MLYLTLISLLALLTYFVLSFNVGRARSRFGVKAPATIGNLDFERRYRAQMNTLEQIVLFIPSLWVFNHIWNAPYTASALGLLWIIGRILYAHGYYRDAESRYPGFILTVLSTSILLFGAIAGVMWKLAGY